MKLGFSKIGFSNQINHSEIDTLFSKGILFYFEFDQIKAIFGGFQVYSSIFNCIKNFMQ